MYDLEGTQPLVGPGLLWNKQQIWSTVTSMDTLSHDGFEPRYVHKVSQSMKESMSEPLGVNIHLNRLWGRTKAWLFNKDAYFPKCLDKMGKVLT